MFVLGGDLTKQGRQMAFWRRQLATAAAMGWAEELQQLAEETDGCSEEAGATDATMGRAEDLKQLAEKAVAATE